MLLSHTVRFQKFVIIIWNNLGLSNYKLMNWNLEFRKKNHLLKFKKELFSSLFISRPFLRSGKNNLLNFYKKMFLKMCVFFSNLRFLFVRLYLDRPKLFPMIVSDEFLKQCETEAFLKLNSCFSTEFALLKRT